MLHRELLHPPEIREPELRRGGQARGHVLLLIKSRHSALGAQPDELSSALRSMMKRGLFATDLAQLGWGAEH